MNIILPKGLLRRKTGPEFDIVADSDFNPDIVLAFGYDMYENGFNDGFLVGGIIATSVIATAVFYGVYQRNKERWAKEKEAQK